MNQIKLDRRVVKHQEPHDRKFQVCWPCIRVLSCQEM